MTDPKSSSAVDRSTIAATSQVKIRETGKDLPKTKGSATGAAQSKSPMPKRGADQEGSSDASRQEILQPGSKKAKKEKTYTDFRTIRQIIDESNHGRKAPEGELLSYFWGLLNEMEKEYPLDRASKIATERRKCSHWETDYARFLLGAHSVLEEMKDKPQYTGSPPEEVEKVIDRIDKELSNKAVAKGRDKLTKPDDTIQEACRKVQHALDMSKKANNTNTKATYTTYFKEHYERNRTLIQKHENDPEWKEQIEFLNQEYARRPRHRDAKLPNRGAPGFEEALRGKYLDFLVRIHETACEFFMGNKDTDFKSLYQRYQRHIADKRNCERNNADGIKALTKDKALLPPNVSQENFDCLQKAFRNFRVVKKGYENRTNLFQHINEIIQVEKEFKKSGDQEKAKELKKLKDELPRMVDEMLEVRKAFRADKENKELDMLLSEMEEARKKEKKGIEKSSAMANAEPASTQADRSRAKSPAVGSIETSRPGLGEVAGVGSNNGFEELEDGIAFQGEEPFFDLDWYDIVKSLDEGY